MVFDEESGFATVVEVDDVELSDEEGERVDDFLERLSVA